jgi:hypothetical protein
VRDFDRPKRDRRKSDIIPPLRTTSLPPKEPNANYLSPVPFVEGIDLPSYEDCLERVSRFFREVHCVYWLYSSEMFHAQLDKCYSNQQSITSRSWLCSLYSILSISPHVSTFDPSGSDPEGDSLKYLALAKALVHEVYDEADLESVRALILLVSFLSRQCLEWHR